MSGIEDCLAAPSLNKGEGLRVVCIRETLRDLKESAKLLIERAQNYGETFTSPPWVVRNSYVP